MTGPCEKNPPDERDSLGWALILAATLALLASVSATIYFCLTMSGGMNMPGGWTMSMMWMPMAGQSWAGCCVMFMEMWLAMMVAMMLPSALPMIARYYRARRRQSSMAGAEAFLLTAAYFFVWMVAGTGIFVVGAIFAAACMKSDALCRATPFLLGAAVVGAGIMQFMPWTRRGLSHCRGPLSCAISSASASRPAWKIGIGCGISCLACCSGPTVILLALGMMNPLVILFVTLLIGLEKLLPRPWPIVRLAGIASALLGIAMIGRTVI